jgi:hypothetical protein
MGFPTDTELNANRKWLRSRQMTHTMYRVTLYDHYNNVIDSSDSGGSLEQAQMSARNMMRDYVAALKLEWGEFWKRAKGSCRVDIAEIRPIKSFNGYKWVDANDA